MHLCAYSLALRHETFYKMRGPTRSGPTGRTPIYRQYNRKPQTLAGFVKPRPTDVEKLLC